MFPVHQVGIKKGDDAEFPAAARQLTERRLFSGFIIAKSDLMKSGNIRPAVKRDHRGIFGIFFQNPADVPGRVIPAFLK